ALLAGCIAMPTDGPVNEGVQGAPPDDGLELFAPGPAVDATPSEIVNGFIVATGAGVGDDYDRAREFMTEEGDAGWDTSTGVTVYTNSDSLVTTVGDGQTEITAE